MSQGQAEAEAEADGGALYAAASSNPSYAARFA